MYQFYDMQVDNYIFMKHPNLNFTEDELLSAFYYGQHRIKKRYDLFNDKSYWVILCIGERENGDVLEMIAKPLYSDEINEPLILFHAFTPITQNFLDEWNDKIYVGYNEQKKRRRTKRERRYNMENSFASLSAEESYNRVMFSDDITLLSIEGDSLEDAMAKAKAADEQQKREEEAANTPRRIKINVPRAMIDVILTAMRKRDTNIDNTIMDFADGSILIGY